MKTYFVTPGQHGFFDLFIREAPGEPPNWDSRHEGYMEAVEEARAIGVVKLDAALLEQEKRAKRWPAPPPA
ncbi:hypothetical protein [Thiorhodococcus minor]|uniref:Uncharacterized protein n=1 Tax=Thiorhodococcus minor TaxID=57489 RepID=A0A6M0K0J1_9GAMM|nr:hypothetical protein [Thiorhodococcus minor]NEV63260.1 hypothetical protein [Thiorhodococcus minor]